MRIRSITQKQEHALKQRFIEWKIDYTKNLEEKIAEIILNYKNSIDQRVVNIWGEIYRAFANIHEDTPSTSFIWWLRAASNYHLQSDQRWARTALESALEQIKLVKYKHEINELIDDINHILTELTNETNNIYIDLIQAEIKRLISAA